MKMPTNNVVADYNILLLRTVSSFFDVMSTSSPGEKIALLYIALRFESISGRIFVGNSLNLDMIRSCCPKLPVISWRCTYNVGNSWFSKGRGNENTFGGNFGSLKKEMIYRWYFLPEKKSKIWLLAKGVCLKGFLQ